MAITLYRYNHTIKKVLGGEVALPQCFFMLLNNNAVFNGAHTLLTQVAGALSVNEVAGNGWPIGGEAMPLSASIVDTNGGLLDAVTVSLTATGGPIGPAYKGLIYDKQAVDKTPLWFTDFGGSQSAAETVDFTFTTPAGLLDVRDYA